MSERRTSADTERRYSGRSPFEQFSLPSAVLAYLGPTLEDPRVARIAFVEAVGVDPGSHDPGPVDDLEREQTDLAALLLTG